MLRRPLGVDLRVHGQGVDAQQVVGGAGFDGGAGGGEEAAEAGDADLDLGARGFGRVVLPDGVDEVVGGDLPVDFEEQGGEHDPLASGRDADGAGRAFDLERTEHPENHGRVLAWDFRNGADRLPPDRIKVE